ncbi:MAG: hypothetical protein BroJett005_11460 [Ignavibacteriota bacterium]|nr:MAG: hypothetical protein BroJett005_11460 [Ignavibacteriota bacterium]
MTITFYQAEENGVNIWLANINRKAIESIEKTLKCKKEDIMYNIITYGKVYYSNREKTIEIESAKSQFKSLGSLITDKVIIEKKDVPINYYIEKNYKKDSRNENILFDPSGDAKFKRDLLCLNDYLRNVGLELLAQVRKFHPYGKLKYHPRTSVFVEKPDNFWAIKIHPKSQNFQIVIRGPLSSFKKQNTHLEIKEDQASYCKFYIETLNQIPDALKLIKEAKWH